MRASQLRVLQSRMDSLVPWLIFAIAATALYLGKPVLIPVILAILLSFLLAPIVGALRRIKMPRPPAVIVAVLLALGGLGVVSAVIVSQAATLGKNAPIYAERITVKVESLRSNLTHRFEFLTRQSRAAEARSRAERARRTSAMPLPTASGALPVEIQSAPLTAVEELKTFILPALAPIETTLIVLIVTIFILFQKEDLRDRVIRLMGAADLHRTTLALDDAARRLSRYFLSQFAVNSAFGAVVWGGLFILGVPAAGLWGILASLLRFVPYVGSVIAAVGPLAIAAAVDPGWGLVLYVALLFVILEPLVGYVVEPLLYGRSTGLSPVSIVLATLFWTWIWGPVGLVLSVPLTLTFVVLGRHIPAFAVFDILLGDQPALTPAESFYQRILAGHSDDALDLAEALLEKMPIEVYYDEVILGAFRLAAADVDRGAMPRSVMHGVCESTLEVLDALADIRGDLMIEAEFEPAAEASEAKEPVPSTDLDSITIVCIPGRGPLDIAISTMLAHLLRRAGHTVLEQSREAIPNGDAALLGPGLNKILCILGLFDQRSTKRMQPWLARLKAQHQGTTIFTGVERGVADSDAGTQCMASLAQLCSAISTHKKARPSQLGNDPFIAVAPR